MRTEGCCVVMHGSVEHLAARLSPERAQSQFPGKRRKL
jgi:hypothetical protein